jgi:hypothetical protein
MADDVKQPEELTDEELRQKSAEEWKKYVREEVNAYLDSFLELSDEGNIGVKYNFAAKGYNEDETVAEHNTKEALGVQLILNFKFEESLHFTDEEGFVE